MEVAPPAPDAASAGVPSAAPSPEVLARARAVLAERAEERAPLGGTRFVVSVSELLAFAEDPQASYRERLLPRALHGAPPPVRLEADEEDDLSLAHPDADARDERRATWDEAHEVAVDGPIDRAALGRAVHAVIERLSSDRIDEEQIQRALLEEWEGDPPSGAEALVRGMV
jgi:hypothetical protein